MASATELEAELDDGGNPALGLDEHYEVVDGRIVEEPALGAMEIRLAARLVRGIVLFDRSGELG